MTDPEVDFADLRLRWPAWLKTFWVHHWRDVPGKGESRLGILQKTERNALVITLILALAALRFTTSIADAVYDHLEPRRPAVVVEVGEGMIRCRFSLDESPREEWLPMPAGETLTVGHEGTVTVPGRRLEQAFWNPLREVDMRRHFYTSAGCLAVIVAVLSHFAAFAGAFLGLFPPIYRWLAARANR